MSSAATNSQIASRSAIRRLGSGGWRPSPTPLSDIISRVISAFSHRCRVVHHDSPDMESIYQLRYRIYIEELRKPLPWADHEKRRLVDPDDRDAIHFLAARRTRTVGCARLQLKTAIPPKVLEAMRLSDFIRSDGYRAGYVSRLMVARSVRGRGVALSIMLNMVEYVVARGCDHGLFHCNPRLLAYYERLGFRQCGTPFQGDHSGLQIPMVFIFGDTDHLRSVRSPLAKFLRHLRLPKDRLSELHTAFFGQPLRRDTLQD